MIAAIVVALLLAAPAGARTASWHSCSVGDSGRTAGTVFHGLTARRPMNCASARYVLNRWIRPQYADRGSVPRHFYDGYVTWNCHKRSGRRWQCNEHESGTAFRFTKGGGGGAPPSRSCDPNYSGCFDPYASDYDCAGGSGDGPKYTGPVRVLGDDHYDLDRDGDGVACED